MQRRPLPAADFHDSDSEEDEQQPDRAVIDGEDTCLDDTCCCLVACCCETAETRSSVAEGIVIVVCTFVVVAVLVAVTVRQSNSIVRIDAGPLGPTMRHYRTPPQWVDVVYTWVNGSQLEFSEALIDTKRAGRLPYDPHAARYRDDGLFQYSLLSLLQSEALMASVRHVYVVSSGEIPSFLPRDKLRPVRRARRTSAGAVDGSDVRNSSSDSTAKPCQNVSGQQRAGSRLFTHEMLGMPLQPLVHASRDARSHAQLAHASRDTRRRARRQPAHRVTAGGHSSRLFVVPHHVIFPRPEAELPTFNSNAILACLHRLPFLGDWFVYSDDDTLITKRNITLAAWWDSAHAAQRLYLEPKNSVHQRRKPTANNWEEAMTFMSGLLDRVSSPVATPPGPPSHASHIWKAAHAPPTPPLPYTATELPYMATELPPSPLSEMPPQRSLPCHEGRSLRSETARDSAPPSAINSAMSSAPPSAINSALPAAGRARSKPGLQRFYARPQHMPVLMARGLVEELEVCDLPPSPATSCACI